MLEGTNQWQGLGCMSSLRLSKEDPHYNPGSLTTATNPESLSLFPNVWKHSGERNLESEQENPLVSSTFNVPFLEMLLRNWKNPWSLEFALDAKNYASIIKPIIKPCFSLKYSKIINLRGFWLMAILGVPTGWKPIVSSSSWKWWLFRWVTVTICKNEDNNNDDRCMIMHSESLLFIIHWCCWS